MSCLILSYPIILSAPLSTTLLRLSEKFLSETLVGAQVANWTPTRFSLIPRRPGQGRGVDYELITHD